MSEGNLGYPYEDVEGDAWYAMPVYWARENGVMAGYSDSTFGPNDPITREQLAATLYKYAEYKGEDVSAALTSAATATLQRSATGQKKC